MKKSVLTVFASLFALTLCFGQDVITTRAGLEIQARIFEVGQTEVKYKRFDNLEGPTFIIPKSEILLVLYENGTSDLFSADPQQAAYASATAAPAINYYMKGQADAMMYYGGYKPAATGTLVAGLVSPLLGLIPAIACSSTSPQPMSLYSPDAGLMVQSDYLMGYTHQAKKIKQGKVWKNWGIAFGANLVAVLLLTAGQ
ncbi:hypothetical protein [Pontibacter beigongshangensis]|uniref:hypothetical protein n=1 Tax=Pontibacter beigongshangensis TaxID=2574733 RepID=UPI0016506D6B|nr:hypothetical protein [Pontibacter beigongshangensis]